MNLLMGKNPHRLTKYRTANWITQILVLGVPVGVCGQKTYQPSWPIRVTWTSPEGCLPNLGVDCTPGLSPGGWPARPLEPQPPTGA